MPTEVSIEKRLVAVEQAVAELQRRTAPTPPARNWLEQITGSFRDEPAFEQVLAYGRAFRESDRPGADEGS